MKRLHDGASGSIPASGKKSCPSTGQLHLNSTEVFRLLGFWLVDRSRIYESGAPPPDYVERYMPWYLLGQFSRTFHRGRLDIFNEYIRTERPCYGILVYKIDYEIWNWFIHECVNSPVLWFADKEEPLDVHTNEYLEISRVNLRGDYCAFKKFPNLNEPV